MVSFLFFSCLFFFYPLPNNFTNESGFTDLVKKLSGHEGFVKGVVFDPVGQYLATQVSYWFHAWAHSLTSSYFDSPTIILSRYGELMIGNWKQTS